MLKPRSFHDAEAIIERTAWGKLRMKSYVHGALECTFVEAFISEALNDERYLISGFRIGGAVAHAAIDQILRRPMRLLFFGSQCGSRSEPGQFVHFETFEGLEAARTLRGCVDSKGQLTSQTSN